MYADPFLLLNPLSDGLILIRFKHLNKPTTIGRSSSSTSSPQRYAEVEAAARVRRLIPCVDAGLRRLRTMACQILRTQVGGDTPRESTFRHTVKLPPGPMGHRTLQPGGLSESSFAQSQPETAPHTVMQPNHLVN